MPLPLMTASNAAPAGVSETAKVPEKTSAPPNVSPFLREPFVFAEETRFLTDTEEAVLSQIVREFFEKGDWDTARALLQQYPTLPRSKDTGERARFYLGQTWYFTENYREALFEFLAVKPVYPAEAGIWIDAVLAAMVK
jgi:TolA-binding protein